MERVRARRASNFPKQPDTIFQNTPLNCEERTINDRELRHDSIKSDRGGSICEVRRGAINRVNVNSRQPRTKLNSAGFFAQV